MQLVESLRSKYVRCLLTTLIAWSVSSGESDTKVAGQEVGSPVSRAEVAEIVGEISELLERYYVSLETGKRIGGHLLQRQASGAYDSIRSPDTLAQRVTTDLRSVNGDLHLALLHAPSHSSAFSTQPPRLDRSGSWSNYGVQEIRALEGNVAYMKIRHFTRHEHLEAAKRAFDGALHAVQESDALIVDVRGNGGGFEDIVVYLVSYFFDGEPIHLADYVYRYRQERIGVYTTTDLPGRKLPDLPLFVLIDEKTGSAAESFAYKLQGLGRATVVGETSAGAGHGAMEHRLNERFSVLISSEEMINTSTQSSFERVGVVPDVAVHPELALNKGYELALAEVQKRRGETVRPSDFDGLIASNDEDRVAILEAIDAYLRVSSGVHPEDAPRAFHESSVLKRVVGGTLRSSVPVQAYADRAALARDPERRCRLTRLSVHDDLAMAEIAVHTLEGDGRVGLLLLEAEGVWQIAAEASSQHAHPR